MTAKDSPFGSVEIWLGVAASVPMGIISVYLALGNPEVIANEPAFATGMLLVWIYLAAFAITTGWVAIERRRNPYRAYAWLISLMATLAGLLLVALLWWLGEDIAEANRSLFIAVAALLVPHTALTTVYPPNFGRLPILGHTAFAIVPVGITLYFVTHPGLVSGLLLAVHLSALVYCLAARYAIQKSLDDAHAGMQSAQRSRERFLASASHDLAQPLQSARLSLYHAQQHADPAVQASAFRRIDWAFGAMEAMVGQITEHLKLESGEWRASMGEVALAGAIGRAVALNEAAARIKQIELRAADTALVALGDPDLIGRVLGNFITNAIRHAGSRRILVAARKHGERVRLWVIDNGTGIAESDLARLFEHFAQGDHKGEVRGGFGLGLASTRKMAELMDGRAGHEPRWRGGSAFFLELGRI